MCILLSRVISFRNYRRLLLSQLCLPRITERCGAVVKHRTPDREVTGSIPTNSKCCFLEQEALSTLLSTGFYPGKKRATWKISTKLLNVLPSINKVNYYYYYYYYYLEVKTWSLCKHGTLTTGNKKLWKEGAISPLFHNIFNISLTSGVKLHIHL